MIFDDQLLNAIYNIKKAEYIFLPMLFNIYKQYNAINFNHHLANQVVDLAPGWLLKYQYYFQI